MSNLSNKDQKKPNHTFLEILGDTISGNHLLISIFLSVLFSLGGYKLGQWIFPNIADESMVNSYSLLVGITGTIIILLLNSYLFKPKRILVEDNLTSDNLVEIFEDLQLDIDKELELIQDDPVTKKELEQLGVLSNFTKMNKGDGK